MRRICLAIAVALPLLARSAPLRAEISVAVDPSANARPISPLIYGVNFPSDEQLDQARLTVARWGGNAVTRYNYEIDTNNTAADYFFENIPGCFNAENNWCSKPPADPKESSSANAFLAKVKAKGAVALFTIPTIGWVAKSPPKYGHPFDCGCPKAVNANQDQFDVYDTNCGNGQVAGATIDCGPESNTSVAVNPAWAKGWVSYIVSKFGPANGQRIYALDNEPALWSSTHRDIRKTKLGYDELWQRMRDYAVAILEADPTAAIAGPAEWGWPNYFCSDADNISQGCFPTSPDRKAHGGQELVAWLLDQAKAFEAQNGKRILHYLDLHYYPQGGQNPERTRSLWDPSYTDPSWINDKISLVPRMRAWVEQHYPGTRLAVSEYDFYDHEKPAGAVTYAEVLGIFGREGVDVATAWAPPGPAEPAFAAFKLYRNFDGKGGQFEAVSVKVDVSGGAGVSAYAAVGKTRMTVALVNESGSPADIKVTTGNFEAGATAAVFTSGAGSAIDKKPDVPVAGGAASLTLPGTSITMLVVDGNNPNNLPDPIPAPTSSGSGASSASAGAAGGPSGGAGGGASGGSSDGSSCGCRWVGDATGGRLSVLAIAGLAAAARARARRRRRR
jgi:hypothetical protein